jgi:hypothetical protein
MASAFNTPKLDGGLSSLSIRLENFTFASARKSFGLSLATATVIPATTRQSVLPSASWN